MPNPMMGDSTVTIDRAHFETILRRANFNADDVLCPAISVSRSEYAGLKSIAAKYTNLCQNLLRGGVGEETIDLLSNDDASTIKREASQAPLPAPAEVKSRTSTVDRPASPKARPYAPRTYPQNNGGYNSQGKAAYSQLPTKEEPDWATDVDPEDSASGGGPLSNSNNNGGAYDSAAQARANDRPLYERKCARSLMLTNLAEGTTHAEVTEAVRGGQLLEIYLRSHDRTASISFLNAADARAFFDHVRRHDLYIRQKRVDIRWSERQFTLPGHLASKIASGATRNLVIRCCDPRFTEDAIRDDLEHIHNLIVIKVDFMDGSCHIKTNSVHNASFARTCMMSRLKYKHNKIEWDVDECAQPMEQPVAAKPPRAIATPQRHNRNVGNRFQLLKLDEVDEDSLTPSTAFSPKKVVGIVA